MHRKTKDALANAAATSEFVIAVNIDIRGFTSFCRRVESPEAAIFVKKMFLKLVDEVFVNSVFYKLHGDGLVLLYNYTESNLYETFTFVINTSLYAVQNFKQCTLEIQC